ncbi:TetR/AcrR family transcriptional regulator [Dactylosporangium sp. NPDC049742]|uniref:TetR/AcrR family transcriptional regulator n=1 Tax=Dactylosporangium sp. NPDC049742 TaxID=3154737 RepID=UPI00343AA360
MEGRGRNTDKTRRMVLDAAAEVVGTHGAGASVDTIARHAGVSKGGVLHHFKSRDQMLLALAEDLIEQFRAAVHAAIDPHDNAPGRLARGYVNATFDELVSGDGNSEFAVLVATLFSVPGVAELLRQDSRRWAEAFDADGLHPQRARVIMHAADGASIAGLYGGSDLEALEQSRHLLLALSRQEGPLLTP